MVRVGRLELPASCSQTCVGTFSRHFTALFGPSLCLGSSSLTLFCPACFKKPFRLLGFEWDWILYTGQQLGITSEQRQGRNGTYTVVVYNKAAQQFILDNLDATIE